MRVLEQDHVLFVRIEHTENKLDAKEVTNGADDLLGILREVIVHYQHGLLEQVDVQRFDSVGVPIVALRYVAPALIVVTA